MRAGELEFLFTADTAPVAKAEKDVKAIGQRIEKNPTIVTLKGADGHALAAMDRVEDAAKQLVSKDIVARVEADISNAETETQKLRGELDYLNSIKGEVQVDADIERAEGKLRRADRTLQSLQAARATMEVDADTASAEAALDDVADAADDAGADGGRRAGASLSAGIVAALATIPIAGAVIGVGVAAGKALADAIQDGLAVDKRQDRLQGLTGITEGEAARVGRAAGEAYAGNFGESIESNMDTARIALQGDLLDPGATVRQSQQVIQSLAGIADVLDEDVRPVSVAVTQLLKTGLVKTADEAFDLLATGAREGVNAQEDLLDTLTEYPSLFQRLGLTGPEALGLVNQGLKAGARNSDLAADALKEFQIRATDGSKASAEGFRLLGLDAKEMTAQIAAGGEGAREGLDVVLDKLREIEDPVTRNAAAVALFGTQAEDLGQALFAMDLSNAVDQLNGVQGSAQRMFDTLASNDATKIEEARRNIEVAADGIKGALAAAFSEPLGEMAEFVSQNRGEVVRFLLDIANGALDAGRGVVEFTASGTEAIGGFIAGPLADLVDGVGGVLDAVEKIPGVDLDGAADSMHDLADTMRNADDNAADVADTIRRDLIENGIDPAQQKLNEFGIPQIIQAEFHDASMRAATALDAVGYAADGSQVSLEGVDLAALGASESGALLEGQLRNAVAALDAEAAAGARAGETQETLAAKYEQGRQALALQLQQMGLTSEQAWGLIETYGAIPSKVDTAISSNAGAVTVEVGGLAHKVEHLPDGSFSVTADTSSAERTITAFVADQSGRRIPVYFDAKQGTQINRVGLNALVQADGGVVDYFANGAENHVAQIAPAGAWRVWAEPETGGEAYIPLAQSKRSRSTAILEDVAARFGFGLTPMSDGGVTTNAPTVASRAAAGPLVARISPEDIRALGDYILAGSRQVSVGAVRTARAWGGG
jgi:phage-related minor tail protein